MADVDWEAAILDLLSRRSDGATVCPSEVARDVRGDDEADWRPAMDDVRAAAARLAARREVVVTQRGDVVDLATARGPVRIGCPDPGRRDR